MCFVEGAWSRGVSRRGMATLVGPGEVLFDLNLIDLLERPRRRTARGTHPSSMARHRSSRRTASGDNRRMDHTDEMRTTDIWDQLTVRSLHLSPAFSPDGAQTTSDVVQLMQLNGYDVAPVWRGNDLVVLQLDALLALGSDRDDTPVANAVTSMSDAQRIGVDTPLPVVMDLLAYAPFLVAVDTFGGTAVVTHADLARPQFSAMAFSTILELESALNRYLELFDDPETLAREALSARAIERIDSLIAERRRTRTELDFLASLSFEDRFEILRRDRALSQQLGLSTTALSKLGKQLQKIRNSLAHAGSLLDVSEEVTTVLRHLACARNLTSEARRLVVESTWTRYSFAEVKLDAGIVLAGRAARRHLGTTTWVVTADNPEAPAAEAGGRSYNELTAYLRGRRIRHEHGWGGRRDHWERSAIVTGIDRGTACEIGTAFGQCAVFELTETNQITIECLSAEERRVISRVR